MDNDSEKLVHGKKYSKGSSKPSTKIYILVALVVSLSLIAITVGLRDRSNKTPASSTTETPPLRPQEPLSGGPLDESVEIQDFQDKVAAEFNEGQLLSGESFEEDMSVDNFEIPSPKHSQDDELDESEEDSFEDHSMEEHFENSIEGETDDKKTNNTVVDKDIEARPKETIVKKRSIREEDPIWEPEAEEEIEERLVEESTTLFTAEVTESTSNADVLKSVDTADVPESAPTIVTPLTDKNITEGEKNEESKSSIVDEAKTKTIGQISTESTEETSVTDIPEETLEVVSQELVDIVPEIDESNEVEQENVISEESDDLNDVSEEDKGTTEFEEAPYSEEDSDAHYLPKEEL